MTLALESILTGLLSRTGLSQCTSVSQAMMKMKRRSWKVSVMKNTSVTHPSCVCFLLCFFLQPGTGRVLTLWFIRFVFQGQSQTEMLRRAPKAKPTQTWLKSYLYIVRTVTCLSSGAAMISQVMALTCLSLTTPTHYGEIKLFTTGFITVPEMSVYSECYS